MPTRGYQVSADHLKNVRVLKPNELGTLTFHPTGYEGYGLGAELNPVDDGWLLTDYEGICLLDKDIGQGDETA